MTAGLVGFLVILALVVASVFLFRSMVHQMRKVPPSFDDTEPHSADSGEDTGDSHD
jgi:hypothetical protein